MSVEFGVIGGSGFYSLSTKGESKEIETPFGVVPVSISKIKDKKVAFITRHGKNHSLPPHLVNYRANIFALHTLGVQHILTTSAVGSMKENITPGSAVIPDQFIDFTIGRPKTFFDGKFKIKLTNGQMRKGVVHVDLTEPYCSNLRENLITVSKEIFEEVHEEGVYVCTEGPRFETPAEIKAFKVLGGNLVGMTSVSECVLARELDICYATICLVTNYAAGMQEKISTEEVFSLFKTKVHQLEDIIMNVISQQENSKKECFCAK